MATVRITNDVRSHVRNKITTMFESRIKAKYEELQHLDVGMQVFRNRVPQKDIDTMIELNKNVQWVHESASLEVTIKYRNAAGVQRIHRFRVPFKPPVPLPSVMSSYANVDKNVVAQDLLCYQPCVDVILAAEALVTERDKLINALMTLLDQCSTLRQVLDVWPTAMDYMPDEVKQRHAMKVEKREKTVISEVSDETKILLMKTRMLTGT